MEENLTEILAHSKARLLNELKMEGITESKVIDALQAVPREMFIPHHMRKLSYENKPLPIGYQQTISQPWIVGFMSQLSDIKSSDRVLEIGTGSGYQTAVLLQLADEVCTVERIADLQSEAKKRLQKLYPNKKIYFRLGDGAKGWKEKAPFDVILVTACASEVPEQLLKQLAEGGRLIIPCKAESDQNLLKITRKGNRFQQERTVGVSFVPLISDLKG